RTVFGRAIYWTGVYLVDGLLVDSGPPNLARDVRRLVSDLAVRQCVTTHHHEDHSGNHALLAGELRIIPLAHPNGASRLALADIHPRLYRRVAWGARPPAPTTPLGERLATPRLERRRRRTRAPGERSPLAGVDRWRLLQAKFRAGVLAARPVRRPHPDAAVGSGRRSPARRWENTRHPTKSTIMDHVMRL